MPCLLVLPRRRVLVTLGVAALAGCRLLGGGALDLDAPSPEPVALREALDRFGMPASGPDDAAERLAFVAERLREAGLAPVLDSLVVAGGLRVLALVPGRHPAHRDTLVVAMADVDDPAAATLLAAAPVLSAQAAVEPIPARSILFVFAGGPAELRAALDLPFWPEGRIARGRYVTGEPDRARALGAMGWPVEPVVAGSFGVGKSRNGAALRFTHALLDTLRADAAGVR
ncbi:MAG TPA: hypothetical protein VD962_08950 [Rubricoccaceae bacterium]|nr:hypothetical protein [Rubricoccaceae bacterium]